MCILNQKELYAKLKEVEAFQKLQSTISGSNKKSPTKSKSKIATKDSHTTEPKEKIKKDKQYKKVKKVKPNSTEDINDHNDTTNDEEIEGKHINIISSSENIPFLYSFDFFFSLHFLLTRM